MTLQGFPTLRIFEEQRDILYGDFILGSNPTAEAEAEQLLLRDLHDRFSRENKNMEDYGLPAPSISETEVDRELRILGTREENLLWLQQLNVESPNTDEMNHAFAAISHAILNVNEETSYFFIIRGVGGAGKTVFAKKVYSYMLLL